jgi:Bacterial Ig-like domain/WD40-like Beta Propeller Repeat
MLGAVISEKGRLRDVSRRALILLTTMVLVLAVASGAATAKTGNGFIYFSRGSSIAFVDPQITTPQPTYIGEGTTFDISRDRTTLVYSRTYFGGWTGPLYTLPLTNKSCSYCQGTEVRITNLYNCDLDCDFPRIDQPEFSPDGKTIYFKGMDVLSPSEDTPGIYSVPTRGGQATRIPIDWFDGAGSPIPIQSFALSHDGSKFALGGPFAGGPSGLFTVPISGGVPTRVTTGSCGGTQYPSFSPDDQMIVYTDYISSGDNCSGTLHRTVFTTPADSNGTLPGTPLFPEDAVETSPYVSKWDPTYSPDGKYIAFEDWRGGTDRLATAPATGGSITYVTSCAICDPLWIEQSLNTTITSLSSLPSGSGVTTSVAFSSNDEEATFECKLDDGNFEPCTSPKEYPDLAEGSAHTFEVRAVDTAGNTDPTPASRTWTADTIAPTVKGVSPVNAATSVALNTNIEATFSEDMNWSSFSGNFTLSKQGSSTSISCWSTGYSSVTKTATLNPCSGLEANTTYTARLRGGDSGAKDPAGNALAQDYSWSFTTAADTTAPQTTIDSGPSGYMKSTSASFSFSSSEAGCAFETNRDEKGWVAGGANTSKSYSNLSQGKHTFEVRAVDGAGNKDGTPDSRSWFVDTVVPKGTISIDGGNASTSDRQVTLKPSASDSAPASGVASMRFRNGGTTTWSGWSDYSTSKSWPLSAGAGTKTVYVQYRDRARNVSAAATDTIKFSR